jgi:hypothetical protein
VRDAELVDVAVEGIDDAASTGCEDRPWAAGSQE